MRFTACLSVLMLCRFAVAAPCATGQAKDAAMLVQMEQTWAHALEQHDTTTLGCLLADEFQDADPDGSLHNRAETLASAAHRRPGSNKLSEMQPHVYGDVGYIRGLVTLLDGRGRTVARVRFTDIYLYRDGRWQAVAGQESMVKEATH